MGWNSGYIQPKGWFSFQKGLGLHGKFQVAGNDFICLSSSEISWGRKIWYFRLINSSKWASLAYKLIHKNEHLRVLPRYCVYQNDSLLKQKSIPSFCCWTATLILALFVPSVFVAVHSYEPLSAGINFLMISVPVPWFTSVLPAGKGIPSLFQLITGRGKPSAWQTTWYALYWHSEWWWNFCED